MPTPTPTPVLPVVPKPAAPPPTPIAQAIVHSTGLLVKCVLTETKPGHVVVDNHACTRDIHTAKFRSVADERNSHPGVVIEIQSLTPMPYVQQQLYNLSLEPAP